MADEFTIQRTPTGLLDMLGMQSIGNTPHALNPNVQATVDVSNFFTIDRLVRSSGSTAVIAAIGFATANVGPAPGELWLVDTFQVDSGALAAASAIRYVPAVIRQGALANTQYFGNQQLVANPNTVGASVIFERPLILRPGDIIGAQILEVTGVPGTVIFCKTWHTVLRI